MSYPARAEGLDKYDKCFIANISKIYIKYTHTHTHTCTHICFYGFVIECERGKWGKEERERERGGGRERERENLDKIYQ